MNIFVRVVLIITLSVLIGSSLFVWNRIPGAAFVPAKIIDQKIAGGKLQSGVPLQGEGICPSNIIGCHLVIVGADIIRDVNADASSNIYYTAVLEVLNGEFWNTNSMTGKMTDLMSANWFRPQQSLILPVTNNNEMFNLDGVSYRASFTLSELNTPFAAVELWVRWVVQEGVLK
jgi:hypothetical protein